MTKKIKLHKKNRKLYLIFFGLEISIFDLVMLIFAIISARIALAALNVAIDSNNLQKEQLNTKPAMVYDRTPFENWVQSDQAINDLVRQGNLLSLSNKGYQRQRRDIWTGHPIRDPQGYIQSPKTISENVFICTKVLSHNNEIDYSLRLNYKFQIIHGDGDNRSIALKQISSANPNGDYLRPDTYAEDPHIDQLNRFRLEQALPLGKEFTTCLTIHAVPGGSTKDIKIQLSFLNDNGDKMDIGPLPTWTLVDNTQRNSTANNFAVGLIDSRNTHPELELRGYCAVEMNDLGDKPSEREYDLCSNP